VKGVHNRGGTFLHTYFDFNPFDAAKSLEDLAILGKDIVLS
jgi:hypothetical protein